MQCDFSIATFPRLVGATSALPPLAIAKVASIKHSSSSSTPVPPTQAELNNLLQFQPGDDWLSLVKKLRPYDGKGHAVGDWHFYLPIDYPPLIHRYFSPLLSQTKPM
jgi:hypothetical protein